MTRVLVKLDFRDSFDELENGMSSLASPLLSLWPADVPRGSPPRANE